MAVRKIKNSWWVDIRIDYIRYRKRSPENTKAGAEAYEALLRSKLARGEAINKVADTVPLFKDFALKWYDVYVVSNNRTGEQTNKRMALNSSLVPFFGNMIIDAIATYNIEQYKAQLRSKGLSAKTINNRLTILSTCLTAAYDWLELTGRPPKITWLKCPPPKTDYLSADEYSLLLTQAEGVLQDMLLVALRTGMRRGEIIGLQWSSINWQNQTITVRHSQCEYTHDLSTTKSSRERHIPIDADVYTALFKRKCETGYEFLDKHKQRFSGKRLSSRLDELCVKVGLRQIGWHTLRHTFASHLAMNGVPLNAVQALLGHSAITTTMRYAHLAPSTLRDAIGTLNPKTMLSGSFGQPVGNRWNKQKQEAAQND